ncbi:dynein axonemal light chain 1 isoform X4 [Petaurus breviceps papuanus]
MDASLSMLANCEKLSLSTNCIEKIANLNGLKNLRILSLGRNNIKNLNGLEAVGDTLEELWISYNFIEKLKGIHVMKRLKILYMSNNLVKDWGEFVKLAELGCLEELVFVGNPLEEKYSTEGIWIDEATRRVPKLKKLDGFRQGESGILEGMPNLYCYEAFGILERRREKGDIELKTEIQCLHFLVDLLIPLATT